MSEVFTAVQLRAKKWKGQPATFAQVKKDGWRCSFFRQRSEIGSKPMVAFGRDRSKKGEYRPELNFFDRFPRLWKHPAVLAMIESMPPHSMVDTEITVGGGVRSDVVTALKDESIPIDISCFAIPHWDGHDTRSATLEWADAMAGNIGIQFLPYYHLTALLKLPAVSLAPTEIKRNYLDYSEKLMAIANEQGFEGWVLKQRSHCIDWYKVKGTQSVDCILMGTVPGEGKYEGMVGSIRCGVFKAGKIVEICTCSGMTDDERAKITELDRGGWLRTRVVEVKYQMVGAGGRLVHPRFVRFREDRTMYDCGIEQIEEVE